MLNGFHIYLLAAGSGHRAGGPKAWLEYEGRSLLENQIEFLSGLFTPQNIAVSIQEGWLSRCKRIQDKVSWVAVDPEDAPLGALQNLMQASPLDNWAFLYHVDMPLWEGQLFNDIAGFAVRDEAAGFEAIAPTYQGRKGHPILLSPQLGKELLSLNPRSDRLDHWLRTRKEATVELPFPCIHENWNEGVMKR